MIYILLAVIILQFAYIVFKDISYSKEREKLQLKLMSRDVTDYKEATEPPAKDAEEKPSPYRTPEEVSTEKLLKAEDRI